MATLTAAPRCTEGEGGCLETQNIKNTLKSPRWCQSLLVESSFRNAEPRFYTAWVNNRRRRFIRPCPLDP